eukprot:TRINITY_DN6181_c0_g1_i11.p1 TRINITY_DN6181_c0_g1~~TRINITY_DN6181_c0_g1_i11.p1  ORF type:complete len:148 (+),score=17.65 TRINITY_DN6181_c0_g1_i11:236-679(+)
MQKTYPCRLYFIYSVTDLFLLTYGCYLILRAVESVSQNWPTLAFESGRYGKHKLKSWFYQLIIWLFIVFLVRQANKLGENMHVFIQSRIRKLFQLPGGSSTVSIQGRSQDGAGNGDGTNSNTDHKHTAVVDGLFHTGPGAVQGQRRP